MRTLHLIPEHVVDPRLMHLGDEVHQIRHSYIGQRPAPVRGGLLRVADDGPGLPDDAIRVLTGEGQPKSQRSRRLGLWLVHQLIDDVDGRVAIHTRSEAGTIITITIPARAPEGDKD